MTSFVECATCAEFALRGAPTLCSGCISNRANIRMLEQRQEDLLKEHAALLAQLPEGMKHCTIVIDRCEKGHSRLIAANWEKIPCMKCALDDMTTQRDGWRAHWLNSQGKTHDSESVSSYKLLVDHLIKIIVSLAKGA